jgi:hypothetical protein
LKTAKIRLRGLWYAAAAAMLVSLACVAAAQDKKAAATPAAKPAASPCKGLDQAACGEKSADFQWITPKAGKQKPYCRLKSTTKKSVAPKQPKQ